MKIGIMGGTFDPVHVGHLFLAQEVLHTYSLDQVVFVPSKIGPHKLNVVKTSPEMRYKMVEAAIADNRQFSVSDVELRRQGISYTIDTINYFRDLYKSDSIYFITGADAIIDIESWRDYQKLLCSVTFIAATRPSLNDEKLKIAIDRLNRSYCADIQMMKMLRLEISSSDIRKRYANGEPIKYLVSRQVEQLIVENNLYAL